MTPTAEELAKAFCEKWGGGSIAHREIAKLLTTYAEQVRREAIEECAKIADLLDVGAGSIQGRTAQYIARKIREPLPSPPSGTTMP